MSFTGTWNRAPLLFSICTLVGAFAAGALFSAPVTASTPSSNADLCWAGAGVIAGDGCTTGCCNCACNSAISLSISVNVSDVPGPSCTPPSSGSITNGSFPPNTIFLLRPISSALIENSPNARLAVILDSRNNFLAIVTNARLSVSSNLRPPNLNCGAIANNRFTAAAPSGVLANSLSLTTDVGSSIFWNNTPSA